MVLREIKGSLCWQVLDIGFLHHVYSGRPVLVSSVGLLSGVARGHKAR